MGISSSQTPRSRSGRLSVSYRTSSFSHLKTVSFLVLATCETETPRFAREALWPLRKEPVLILNCRRQSEVMSAVDRLRRRLADRVRGPGFSDAGAAGCRGRTGPPSPRPGGRGGLFVHTKPVGGHVFSAHRHHDVFSEVYGAIRWRLLWQCGIPEAATWGTEASTQDVPGGLRP